MTRGDGGPNSRRRRKYSGSGRSSVISGPSPVTVRPRRRAIQTRLWIRPRQPSSVDSRRVVGRRDLLEHARAARGPRRSPRRRTPSARRSRTGRSRSRPGPNAIRTCGNTAWNVRRWALNSSTVESVRRPLHHHATRVQAGVAGLVVLERRDDRRARALDRRRRVGDDDVVGLVGELQVVPAVGDDHVAVRVREDRARVGVEVAEHQRDRRDELDRVGLEAGDQRRRGRRSPSRTRRSARVFDVRPEHERQDRHELRVDREQRHRRPGHPQLRA